MPQPDPNRIARQILTTDALLGTDWTPTPATSTLSELLESPTTPTPPTSHSPRPITHTSHRYSDSSSPAPTQSSAPTAPTPLSQLPNFEPNDLSPKLKTDALAQLQARHAETCPHCTVQPNITNIVFGEGDPNASLLLIGEGPGAEEDRLGRPFVGRSGQLLDKQIGAMGLSREQVYIANIVKTRPPANRVPTPEEATLCAPFLYEQIQIIAPKVIITLGATAAKYLLLEPKLAITRQRGTWRDYRGIPLMPTFHPAYLLRQFTVENRRRVWDDLQKVMTKLGLPTK